MVRPDRFGHQGAGPLDLVARGLPVAEVPPHQGQIALHTDGVGMALAEHPPVARHHQLVQQQRLPGFARLPFRAGDTRGDQEGERVVLPEQAQTAFPGPGQGRQSRRGSLLGVLTERQVELGTQRLRVVAAHPPQMALDRGVQCGPRLPVAAQQAQVDGEVDLRVHRGGRVRRQYGPAQFQGAHVLLQGLRVPSEEPQRDGEVVLRVERSGVLLAQNLTIAVPDGDGEIQRLLVTAERPQVGGESARRAQMLQVQFAALGPQGVGGRALHLFAGAVVAGGTQQIGVVMAEVPDARVSGAEQGLPGGHGRCGEPDSTAVLSRKVHVAKAVEDQLLHQRIGALQDPRPLQMGRQCRIGGPQAGVGGEPGISGGQGVPGGVAVDRPCVVGDASAYQLVNHAVDLEGFAVPRPLGGRRRVGLQTDGRVTQQTTQSTVAAVFVRERTGHADAVQQAYRQGAGREEGAEPEQVDGFRVRLVEPVQLDRPAGPEGERVVGGDLDRVLVGAAFQEFDVLVDGHVGVVEPARRLVEQQREVLQRVGQPVGPGEGQPGCPVPYEGERLRPGVDRDLDEGAAPVAPLRVARCHQHMSRAGGHQVLHLVGFVGTVQDQQPAAVRVAVPQRVLHRPQPFAVLRSRRETQLRRELSELSPEHGAAVGGDPPHDVVLGAEPVDILHGQLRLADAGHAVQSHDARTGAGSPKGAVGAAEQLLAAGEPGVTARYAAPHLGGVEREPRTRSRRVDLGQRVGGETETGEQPPLGLVGTDVGQVGRLEDRRGTGQCGGGDGDSGEAVRIGDDDLAQRPVPLVVAARTELEVPVAEDDEHPPTGPGQVPQGLLQRHLDRRVPPLLDDRHPAPLQTVPDPGCPGLVETGEADGDGLCLGWERLLRSVRVQSGVLRFRGLRASTALFRAAAQAGVPLQERAQQSGPAVRRARRGVGLGPVPHRELLDPPGGGGGPSGCHRYVSADPPGRRPARPGRFPDAAGKFGLADRRPPLVGNGEPQHRGTGGRARRHDEPRRAVRTTESVQYDAGVVEHLTDEVRGTVERDAEGQFLLLVRPGLAVLLVPGVERAT